MGAGSMKQKLTKSVVDSLVPAAKDIVVWDTELPGFGVRVKPGGLRSYIVQYRDRQTGESRRKTIGQHGPLLSFHKAREQARIILAEALNGRDPVQAERAARAAPNMAALADQYLAQHAVPKKRPRSVKSDRALLDNVVLPRLGGKKVVAVQARDIHALHVAMKDTPYQANRLLALLSKMFSLAIHWGLRGDNPVKGVERYHEERRERWLSDAELKRLLGVLVTHPNRRAAYAVRLQLLTGARIGEVLAARWSEIDFERGVWTKPSYHTKQKRTQHLPRSAPAMALLSDWRSASPSEETHLFPGDAPGKPLQDIKNFWRGVTKAADLHGYRIHDNRHTHASHLVSSGLSLEIVGRLLRHTNPLTTKRYAHLADDPLRAAADRIGSKMAAMQTANEAEIFELTSGRRIGT
jgi:integrase